MAGDLLLGVLSLEKTDSVILDFKFMLQTDIHFMDNINKINDILYHLAMHSLVKMELLLNIIF